MNKQKINKINVLSFEAEESLFTVFSINRSKKKQNKIEKRRTITATINTTSILTKQLLYLITKHNTII